MNRSGVIVWILTATMMASSACSKPPKTVFVEFSFGSESQRNLALNYWNDFGLEIKEQVSSSQFVVTYSESSSAFVTLTEYRSRPVLSYEFSAKADTEEGWRKALEDLDRLCILFEGDMQVTGEARIDRRISDYKAIVSGLTPCVKNAVPE